MPSSNVKDLTKEILEGRLGPMTMPESIYARCEKLQAELANDGIKASIKDCHDLIVSMAVEEIREINAQRVDTVSV